MEPTAKRIKRGWMNLRVERIISETHDCKTLIFVDAEEGTRAFDYVAGQYLTFRFDTVSEKPVVRSYTMSSSPIEPGHIAVTVKKVPEGFISHYLCDQVKEGDILRARGPIGKFCFFGDKDNKKLVMIAAGSGVTPFISIAREYADKLGTPHAPEEMTLLVSYRSSDDLICWETLRHLREQKNVKIFVTLSRENLESEGFWHGRVDAAQIDRAVGGQYGETTFMTCGPQGLMDLVTGHLQAKGVAPESIKLESFDE